MFVIAKGSIARPDALALHLDDEMRVMRKLKAEGLVKSAYGRAAGPGFHFHPRQRRAAFQALRNGSLLVSYMLPNPDGSPNPVRDAMGFPLGPVCPANDGGRSWGSAVGGCAAGMLQANSS